MKRALLIALMLAALTTSSACWSSMEMGQLAIVMGMGIDAADNGEFTVVAQVARPAVLKEGGDGEAYFNVSRTGKAVFSALRDLMNMFSRKAYTQQCEVLLIGEDVARGDMKGVLEYFLRNVESRMSMPLMIARGRAYDVLSQTTYLEAMPAIQLAKMADNQRFTGRTTNSSVFDFIRDLTSGNRQPTAPIVELFEDEQGETKARISGTAVFSGGKMVGALDDDEVYGFLLINNKLHTGVMQITGLGGLIELEITRAQTSLTPVVDGGNVSMELRIEVECTLVSTTSEEHINKVEKVQEIEELARQEITNRVTYAVAAAQSMGSDILGFGQKLYQRYPKEYERINSAAGWDETFKTMPVSAAIDIKVTGTGATLQPIKEGSVLK